jgi:DNA-binding LacI/PurR family transcriptional regulator
VRDRLLGYRKALLDYGLKYDEDLIWVDVYSALHLAQEQLDGRTTSHQRLIRQIARHKPTALFALNPDAARRVISEILAIQAESTLQQKPGQDLELEIVAISHEQPIAYAPYPITIGLQSGETLGSKAAQLLIGRIEGTVSGEAQTIKIPMQIVSANMP